MHPLLELLLLACIWAPFTNVYATITSRNKILLLSKTLIMTNLKFLPEFLVDWSQLFAMSAPRGIELNQDVSGFIHDDFIESVSSDNFYWSIVLLRLFLRLVDGLNLT